MSCGCSSPSVTATSSGSCSPVYHSPGCTSPRRVANPPTVPVTFSWVPRLRSAAQGQLLVSNGCDELMKLESFISGPVMFDAATGMSFVGSGATRYITDAFPCSQQPVFGFPAYGLDPGCRNSGDNPDREIVIQRPKESSIGIPYGHIMGPPNQGLEREISPVHLVPAAFPSTAPTDTFLWLCKELPADDECNARRYEFFKATATQAFSVLPTDVGAFTFPSGPLTGVQDADFGFAVWVLENGKLVLKKGSNATFQSLIKTTNSAKWLDPAATIFDQQSNATYSEARAVNLATLPNYFEAAVEVVLYLRIITYSPPTTGQIWLNTFYVDGRELFQAVGQPAESLQPVTSQVTVPIPDTKILNLNFIKEILRNGDIYTVNNSCGFQVKVQAFR